MTHKKKLIEVALPLEAINKNAQHEKAAPRQGHPAMMHMWWARRPLVVCRAILFAQLVDDPSAHPEAFPTAEEQSRERARLFSLIERLSHWDNTNNESVLRDARAELTRWGDRPLPFVLDPFCGGGSIGVEAQRLGLRASSSDLNPVAVLLTRAAVELPSRSAGLRAVHPDAQQLHARGASGLAEDVRRYGEELAQRAEDSLGVYYPKVKDEFGSLRTVIAWLWARTAKCPSPACGADVPLIRSFWLGQKPARRAWFEPVVEGKKVRFEVRGGAGNPPKGNMKRSGATCLVCGTVLPLVEIRRQAQEGPLRHTMLAIAAEGDRKRVYFAPEASHVSAAESVPEVADPPNEEFVGKTAVSLPLYGMTTHASMYTPRQLCFLDTLVQGLREIRSAVARDALYAGFDDAAAQERSRAVATYLGIVISRLVDRCTTLIPWVPAPSMESPGHMFSRQALPMTWDFAEPNPFSRSSGNLRDTIEIVATVIERQCHEPKGDVLRADAREVNCEEPSVVISTDPPYYNNIEYADLSDVFYVWLKRALGDVWPDNFTTRLTPKTAELVASPSRFGGDKQAAEEFFSAGFAKAVGRMVELATSDYPIVIYYAFKQGEADADSDAVVSTGWQTMLEGLVSKGIVVEGTWPIRTERAARSVGLGTNALASSIVLVCRPRSPNAAVIDRRTFVSALRRELPSGVRLLQEGNVAPVDLAQASIGPGMEIFSRYEKILEADGSALTVRAALGLINQVLDETLTEQEADFDVDTRWAIAWFEQFGTGAGPFGVAETLSKAKNTAVSGLVSAGIVESRAGKVRLLGRDELVETWSPDGDRRLTVWEVTQHLIRSLELGGDLGAASLLRQISGSVREAARELGYRLYVLCEKNRWAQEALAYNALVVAWPEISRLAAVVPAPTGPAQQELL